MLHRQLSLDSFLVHPEQTSINNKIIYNKIHVSQATFLAGLAVHVHRWFRLTPSFGPDLVRDMLAELQCEETEVVLDPFAGAGTTNIECQLKGITSYGFELNPFLHFVGNTSLNWNLKAETLHAVLKDVCTNFEKLERITKSKDLVSCGIKIPPIHNIDRWWRKDVLRQILLLKKAIDDTAPSGEVKNLFRLALAGVLVPDLTNVTLGRLQLHFIDRSKDTIEVLATFTRHAKGIIEDLAALSRIGHKRSSRILQMDTTQSAALKLDRLVNCVVTSPPYPNRYSYIWNTRPHLYMLDFISTGKEASDLDKAAIGGTWGTATSMLIKGTVKADFAVVERVVGPLVEEIRSRDNLMANYTMKYFNMLTKQIVSMDHLLAGNARLAYVVGCSWLKDVYVETDLILAKLLEGSGLRYKVSSIERFRKRNSGKDLYESIVYAWKS